MYEFNLTLELPFEQAVDKVRETLLSEHLGIVSDVDVQAIFKNKMGKEIRPYHIYGACNPKLADRVIASEPNAGVLLPCNFILRETDDGNTVLSFMDPVPVLGLTATDEPKAVAAEARVMLQKVIAKLSA
ncbi:MAG: DUF302 domain-containing protein [Gammaproteobacteria bacterium]|nr:DUF302 domain-containing protein [Gammaproteobacteria bacterium]MCP5430633.1 DUF302 domain-containing protein [Chromatiaceae bacterium]MCP5438093.1 DUF302 domain-containing protein [Chromatiaceae bacterium]MCW5586671.1 DUF302 domain-containing protein [Chromatiales bacterium]